MFESNKFYEVQKYLSLTRHQYNPLIMLVSKKIWDQLNDDERKLLKEAADETRNYQRQVSRDMEKKALELVKAKGTLVNDVPPQEVERMRAKLTAVSEKLAREQIGEAIVKEVYAELERIRGTSK